MICVNQLFLQNFVMQKMHKIPPICSTLSGSTTGTEIKTAETIFLYSDLGQL